MDGNQCKHGGVVTLLMWVACLSAAGFVWAVLFNQSLLNFGADNFFKSAVMAIGLVFLIRCEACK